MSKANEKKKRKNVINVTLSREVYKVFQKKTGLLGTNPTSRTRDLILRDIESKPTLASPGVA